MFDLALDGYGGHSIACGGHSWFHRAAEIAELASLAGLIRHQSVWICTALVVCWRRCSELGVLVPNLVDLFDEIYNESQLLQYIMTLLICYEFIRLTQQATLPTIAN
jgi:hypothetical protein